MIRARITLPTPPTVPPFSAWARLRSVPENPEEVGFRAGAAPGGCRPNATRRIAIRLVLRPEDWMVDLTNALDLPLDAALEDVGDAAKTLAVGHPCV